MRRTCKECKYTYVPQLTEETATIPRCHLRPPLPVTADPCSHLRPAVGLEHTACSAFEPASVTLEALDAIERVDALAQKCLKHSSLMSFRELLGYLSRMVKE